MRWINIRKAKIADIDREVLERLGYSVAQLVFASRYDEFVKDTFERYKLKTGSPATAALLTDRSRDTFVDDKSLLAWLTEQHDYEERRETWLFTMEVAITILVLLEVIFSIINFARR